jgi:tetratricopeptide (TPR) repeat protein
MLRQLSAARSDEQRVELGEALVAAGGLEGEQRIEVLAELYDALRRLGRFERGLEVVRERNSAGWSGVPDGRCDEAEMQLRMGRVDAAATLFEQAWGDSDARWWVANNAGLAYQDADEFAPAAEWLARGCDVAIEHGDPDDLIPQMVTMRRVALTLMQVPSDEAQERFEGYHDDVQRRRLIARDRSGVAAAAMSARPPGGAAAVVMGWFPAGEFERALELWPDGLERFAGYDHREYCRAIEADLRIYSAAMVHVRPAAVMVDVLIAFCDAEHLDPSSADARARYAASLADDVIEWPPGRNDPCWCGSGSKYKKCCGGVQVDPDEGRRLAESVALAERLSLSPFDDDDEPPGDDPAAELVWLLDRESDAFDHQQGNADSDFAEFVGVELYLPMLALARAARGRPADAALEPLRDALDHPLVAPHPQRVADLRLAMADTLAAEGSPGTGLEIAEQTFDQLRAAGIEPDSIAVALALGYLVDLDRIDEAEAGYERLTVERCEDAAAIAEIAGDTLSATALPERALPWLRRHLELALAATPQNPREIRQALRALERESAHAQVEPDAELVERATIAITRRGAQHRSR